jgi:uncharacterized protein
MPATSAFDSLTISERSGPEPTVRFTVHVQPRSKRTGIDGMHGDALRVRVNAPPVDGAANDAVIEVLAVALGVPKRAVSVVAGMTSRSKIIEVRPMTAAAMRLRLCA